MTLQAEITGNFSAHTQVAPQRAGPPKAAQLPLVIGLGNLHLSDDGVGVHLARLLKTTLRTGAAVCMDGGLMSLSLFPRVEAAESLVLLHCADMRCPPGTVDVLEGGDMDGYLRGPRARSIQERGLIDLLDLARQRGCLPARRALVCIQPRRLEWGEALSLPVFQALPMAANRVVGLLERWRGA
jgi:hydrogenase maturation protease